MNADKSSKNDFDKNQALACIPVKNPQVTENRFDSGTLRLSYPVRLKPWFSRLSCVLGQKKDNIVTKRLDLDMMGGQVWDMMDGKASVKEIVHRFAKLHQLPPLEAEPAVASFLKQLGKRGLIAIRDPASGPTQK